MYKILVAIPHIGKLDAGLVTWLMSFDKMGHKIEMFLSEDRPIPSNRNRIIKKFLETDNDYLMMVDSDITPPKNILAILNSNKEIISPMCFVMKDVDKITNAVNKVKREYKVITEFDKGINEVDAVGTGCIFIKRNIIEKMKKPLFKYKYNKEGILSNGEDFNFCDNAKKEGFKIFYDTRYIVNHRTTTIL